MILINSVDLEPDPWVQGLTVHFFVTLGKVSYLRSEEKSNIPPRVI
jgi:hypothetical protein